MHTPNILPLLQSLLAALADLDCAHETDVEAVRGSAAEEWLKRTVIPKLEERHRERRTPYVRQLKAVERSIRAMAA
jgi:hypothetical protein